MEGETSLQCSLDHPDANQRETVWTSKIFLVIRIPAISRQPLHDQRMQPPVDRVASRRVLASIQMNQIFHGFAKGQSSEPESHVHFPNLLYSYISLG
jgi:hypothetical protein